MMSTFYLFQKKSGYGLEFAMKLLGYNGWAEHTVEELVWGYDEPLFDLARFASSDAPSLTKFGFFTKKNLTTVSE